MKRPMNKGEAYEGTVIRTSRDEIVLAHAVFEGPSHHPTIPVLKDTPFLDRYFGDEQGIVRSNVDRREVPIARSEIATVRLLDQPPAPVRREDW